MRRTDKIGTEAAFYPIEDYMINVEEYYKQLELSQPVDVRRVYIASDDPTVINEARKKYTCLSLSQIVCSNYNI